MGLCAKQEGGVIFVQLDNLPAGNSFGIQEAAELKEIVLKSSAHANLKGLIFSSMSPRIFCSGGNLKDYASHSSANEGLQVNDEIRLVLDLFTAWEIPKVAWVEGDCFGGGMELLSCFDHLIASPQALFGFWQRRIALSFGWGGFNRWSQRLGKAKVKKLYLEARNLTSYEAAKILMVDEVQASPAGRSAAEQWLHRLQRWPREPLSVHRKLGELSEEEVFAQLWYNESHRRALNRYKKQ